MGVHLFAIFDADIESNLEHEGQGARVGSPNGVAKEHVIRLAQLRHNTRSLFNDLESCLPVPFAHAASSCSFGGEIEKR